MADKLSFPGMITDRVRGLFTRKANEKSSLPAMTQDQFIGMVEATIISRINNEYAMAVPNQANIIESRELDKLSDDRKREIANYELAREIKDNKNKIATGTEHIMRGFAWALMRGGYSDYDAQNIAKDLLNQPEVLMYQEGGKLFSGAQDQKLQINMAKLMDFDMSKDKKYRFMPFTGGRELICNPEEYLELSGVQAGARYAKNGLGFSTLEEDYLKSRNLQQAA